MNTYVPTERELSGMDLSLDEDKGPCEGCIYDVEGDCGQGLEYGRGGPCFDDGN